MLGICLKRSHLEQDSQFERCLHCDGHTDEVLGFYSIANPYSGKLFPEVTEVVV